MKIAMISGSRADYGLLRSLAIKLAKDDYFDFSLLLCGAFLNNSEDNAQLEEVLADFANPIFIGAKREGDLRLDICKCTGTTLALAGEYFSKQKPDLLIVLGDRYEIFACVSAAVLCGVKIAHFCGGELSFGAFDERLRHAITKLSNLHFCTTKEHAKRVISMGESPKNVFCVGSCSAKQSLAGQLLSKSDTQAKLGFDLDKNTILITYHPVTTVDDSYKDLEPIFSALEQDLSLRVIFTAANEDNGGTLINCKIKAFVKKHPSRMIYRTSLGQKLYFSTLQYIKALLGNSSSGISEAANFALPAINIGSRQKGRMCAENVIHCKPCTKEILASLALIEKDEFKAKLRNLSNPYDQGDASLKAYKILKSIKLSSSNVKEFYENKGNK